MLRLLSLKFSALILFLSICGIFISPTAFGKNYQATHHAIIYEGRVSKDYGKGQVEFNWPGTQLKTKLIGKSLRVTMAGFGDQFDVLVDGELHKRLFTNPNGNFEEHLVYEQSDSKPVIIEIVKRWENYSNNTKVLSFSSEGRIEGIWQQQPHILFIGDSISAGFGSESTKRQCTWREIVDSSNARMAFPYLTAAQLDTSFTQVSYSGLGLIRNWSGNDSHHDLRTYYDKVSAVFGDDKGFEDTHPDLIVLEVGTNDFSTDPQPHEPWDDIQAVKTDWIDTMVEFTNTLRYRYPNAPIVFMPRPAYPYDFIIPATLEAKTRLEALGVEKLYSHTFISPLEGCIWHPTSAEHLDIATKLSQFISQHQLLN
ncbi:GDSL-type esterase/lipase family protein [Pseudoalteromonas sp. SMS1]|uniref:SGNH/GDSL hydrolase family protein n=1 Tax=Pseudoalteromonas sp. SMS1 TaxID=2908894 RepID=UPI001F3DF890|nr:SGNH/GDSL hydrolase family protein [Pseudoalteromonas sp. SMS1]MCF2859835.1 GDSL-type esterase/lipase family protein [Pseudoalteromonas sp. SMS1]